LSFIEVSEGERKHIVVSLKLFRPSFKSLRFTRFCDMAVNFKPVFFADGASDRILQTGLALESRIHFCKAVIHWTPIAVKNHFDNTETFVDRIEQLLVANLTPANLLGGFLAFGHIQIDATHDTV